jgi:hypothetical protein
MFTLDASMFCKTKVPRILKITAVFMNIPSKHCSKFKGSTMLLNVEYKYKLNIKRNIHCQNESRKFRS